MCTATNIGSAVPARENTSLSASLHSRSVSGTQRRNPTSVPSTGQQCRGRPVTLVSLLHFGRACAVDRDGERAADNQGRNASSQPHKLKTPAATGPGSLTGAGAVASRVLLQSGHQRAVGFRSSNAALQRGQGAPQNEKPRRGERGFPIETTAGGIGGADERPSTSPEYRLVAAAAGKVQEHREKFGELI